MKFFVSNVKDYLKYYVKVEFTSYDNTNRKFTLTISKKYYAKYVQSSEVYESQTLEIFAFDWCETYEDYNSICRAIIYVEAQTQDIFRAGGRAYLNLDEWTKEDEVLKETFSTKPLMKTFVEDYALCSDYNEAINEYIKKGFIVKQIAINNDTIAILYELKENKQ